MADKTASIAVAAAGVVLAPSAAPAPAGVPANAVQRTAEHTRLLESQASSADAGGFGAPVVDAAPVVKVYKRQYNTDFSDGARDDAGRDLPTQHEIDAAMPPPDDDGATVAVVDDKPAAREPMTARTTTPTEDKPAEAVTTEPAAVDPAKPAILSREDRRKLLADLDAESTRRTNEQTVHAEKTRLANIETRLKGPLGDRLALAFPDLGTPEQARDKLIEMLVAGQVAPAAEAAKPVEPNSEIAELRREIEALKGTSPSNPDMVAGARLRMVTGTMEGNGVALPFVKREGDAAIAMGVKVAKSMYAMQGNKGSIDGARVMQVVEEHFENQFVSKYGQEAADALKGKKTEAAAIVATPAATVTTQRRPNARRGAPAATGVDDLPMDPAKRHRLIMAEIDAAESTFRGGPR